MNRYRRDQVRPARLKLFAAIGDDPVAKPMSSAEQKPDKRLSNTP
jgi:hypothetical protein